jgi:hypothetical protein
VSGKGGGGGDGGGGGGSELVLAQVIIFGFQPFCPWGIVRSGGLWSEFGY